MRRWYVIEAYEGRDFDVELRLAGAGFEVWRPVDAIEVKRRQRVAGGERVTKVVKRVARFGRYLFARLALTDSVQGAINNQSGVKGFLRDAGSDAPAVIADEWIDLYKTTRPDPVAHGNLFEPGALVRIGVGPFAGIEATVERIDSRKLLTVSISLFGRPTRTLIEAGYVELLERGRPPTKHGGHRLNRKAA